MWGTREVSGPGQALLRLCRGAGRGSMSGPTESLRAGGDKQLWSKAQPPQANWQLLEGRVSIWGQSLHSIPG